MRLFFACTLIILLLNGCMVGPNYKEPIKPIARQWIKPNKTIKEERALDAKWWTVFHDKTLTTLIHQGYEHNVTLQAVGVHVLQARAQLAQAVGNLYPQQQAMVGNLTYQRVGGGSLQDVLQSNFTTLLLGVTANWEIDFWGKYRRAILANDATFLSSYAAYDNALVSLTADIATDYIAIRTTEELIAVTKKNIIVQSIGLDIATARYKAGQVSLLDVEQAQTELSQTQSTLPVLYSNLQQQKDLLGVLLGTTPDKVDCLLGKKNKKIPKSPVTVAVGIPKETIIRRPDVYQARLNALAQSEAIGAVKANLYPSFSLAGNFAFGANTINGNSLNELFNWNNHIVSGGPAFNWPLLNYGQITNAVRTQDAVYQQAVLAYINLVLQAQKEVQDQIVAFIENNKAQKYLETANNAATKSLQLAIIRYREGESDYTPVLDAERQQLQVQLNLTKATGEIPKSLVALYRALGGGWQIRQCNDIVAKGIKRQMAKRTNWGDLLNQPNHQPPTSNAQQIKDIYLPSW